MHLLFVLAYMRDNQKPFELALVTPPRGLFSRILKRLGLEKQLRIVERHLGFFTGLLAVFIFLSIFAFVGLKEVFDESNLGPFLSLVFSDPGMVLKNWQSFSLSVFESMPAAYFAVFLIPLALFLLLIKMAGADFEKLLLIVKSINRQNKKSRQG